MTDSARRFVRVEGREGWWPVWHELESGRVMIQDMPSSSTGPYTVVEEATPHVLAAFARFFEEVKHLKPEPCPSPETCDNYSCDRNRHVIHAFEEAERFLVSGGRSGA